MAKNIKRMFALVMAIVMVLGLGVSALASTDMNKTAKWSDEKYVADVTLSVGGESEDLSSDIIFVMGAGPSYGLVDCQNLVKKMMVATDGTDAKIKFGIVTFADITENEIVLPLTEMKETDPTDQDPSDMDYIISNAILNAKANGQSVNLHSSLETAFNLLKADTSVPNNRKHVFVFTTGLGYFFDTAAGNPATITITDSNGDPCWGNKSWLAVRNALGNTDSGYPIPYGLSWNEYWSLICNWVETDGDTYAYVLDEIYEDFRLSNSTESAIKFGYQITDADDKAAAKEVKVPYFPKATVPLDMLSEEEISALSETELAYAQNANHAMNYERGQYEAWQTINAMRASGCNVYPIQCAGSKWNKAGQISKGYMDMLAGGTCPTVHQAGYFTPIENEILYSVGAGSYVDDYMGYGAEYNFDFIDELGTITLKVGGVKYTTSKLDTAKEGFISSYAFTAPGAETPTFWLDYVKGNGTSEEMFKWSFGESASNDIPVVLDYQVRLVESPANLADELICDTNKVATLYPNGGTPEEFPVPKVTLTPVTYTVTYMNGNVTEQKTSGHKTGDIIPGCVAPEDYFDDTYKYTFSHWKLIEGTEGENKTVGTTDLVYEAVFKSKLITTPEDPTLGKKTDEQLGNDLSYEVKIEVPGTADVSHDEVIIMMDGSYSGDSEWPQARNAILDIGKAVLDGSGHTKLTLMAFGMADNMVLRHINSVSELAARLPEGGLPGGLLYGRSSTNCEAGFTGVAEYVETDAQLRDAYVIFISDGNVNTDETPRAFDADWKAMSTKYGALTVAQSCFEGSVAYGENLPAAFSMFGDRFAGLSKEETLASAFAGETPVTEEELFAFAEQVWTDVYAYSDLVRGVEYPISEVETAFVKYDKEKGTYVQDLFYYATYKSNLVTYPNRWSRTPMAATELASMVSKLYMIDVDGKSNWMDPATGSNPSVNVVGDNVSFTHINAFANFSTVFAAALEELAETVFSNVVVTDYMSKWVNLDPTSVHVVDENTGATIWSATEGWLITENLPTAVEPPVKIEVVSPADYAGGGADVEGNKSGDIYKLTWHVKDGALLRTDNFSLRYNVTVDTAEEGFYPGVSYPANGNTTVTYTGGSNDIKVPNVNVKAYTVTYWTPDGRVVQQTGGLKTGDPIPGCAGLGSYVAGGYTYYFVGWNKTGGVEGAGGKIGTTDLDYVAVMEYRTIVPEKETPTIIEDKVPLAAVPSVFGDDHFAYIVGYPDGNVRPEGNITRAEVATIFFRLLSEEVRQMMWCEENDFSDVNKGYWYNNAISTMAAMGIVEGYPDGTFQPDEFITRAEFAAIAARFELNGNPEGNFFNDTEGHWAEELINIAANNGWVEGYPDGSFRPDNDITRAEAMTLVNRVLHRIPEDESDLLDGMVEWPDNMDKKMWYYLAVQEATNSHDYKRKENPIYETWVDLRENRDWTELEY